MGDGGQVQHGVGGAAQSHVHRLRVAEGGLGHNVPGTDVFFDQLHDLHAGVLGQPQPGGIDGGDGAVSAERHADGLGEAVHGIGGIHTGAAAAGGAGVFGIFPDAFLVQRAGVIGAHRLEHMTQAGAAAVVHGSGQHGPAGAEDGGDVQTGGGHQQAGHVLVTVGDHDQTVELVGQNHGLGGVRDQVTGHQGILHADVAHGDAIAHGDGGEHDGRAAGGADAVLYRLGDLVQVHMAGDDFIIGAHHAHQGAFQLLVGIAQGVQQALVGRALHAVFDLVGNHGCFLLISG